MSVWFNQRSDSSDYWYSNGSAGTVTVVDLGGGELDVLWHDVALTRGDASVTIEPGTETVSVEGWQSCQASTSMGSGRRFSSS